MDYSDEFLRNVLEEGRTIVMVGASTNPVRASYFVASYMHARGRRIIPVNPGQAGGTLFGETIRADFSEIDEPVDMLDIFRRSDAVPGIVGDALAHLRGLKSVWMQFNVTSEEGARMAGEAGLDVVMDRCPKVEYARLMREIGAVGIPSRVISSKLTRRF